MYQKFQCTDGNIFIETDGIQYSFPLGWWLTQEPDYQLPTHRMGEVIGEIYVPGKRHHLTVQRGEDLIQEDGGLNENKRWPAGDIYISKINEYIQNFKLIEETTDPEDTPEEILKKQKRAIVEKELMDKMIIEAAKEPDASDAMKEEAARLESRDTQPIKADR